LVFHLIEDLKKLGIYRQLPEVCPQNSGDVSSQDNAIIDGNEANLWDSIPARLPTASDRVVHDIIFHQEIGLQLLLPLPQDQWQEEFLMEKRHSQKMNTHINQHQIKLQSIELQISYTKTSAKISREEYTHIYDQQTKKAIVCCFVGYIKTQNKQYCFVGFLFLCCLFCDRQTDGCCISGCVSESLIYPFNAPAESTCSDYILIRKLLISTFEQAQTIDYRCSPVQFPCIAHTSRKKQKTRASK
jgi:hypothetical protein